MTLRSLIKRSSLFIAALITVSGTLSSALAQHTLSPDPGNPLAGPANGMRRTDLGWQAFTNATIHVAPGKTIENGTLVVRDGKIVAILPAEGGKPAPMPIGPIVRDCTGMHIYPGFIDAYVEVATPLPDLNAPGAHWSAKVMPQRRAIDGNGVAERDAESLRNQGFVAAAIVPINPSSGRGPAVNTGDDDFDSEAPARANPGGVFRGRGAVVSLQKQPEGLSSNRPPIYRDQVFHALALETGGGGGGGGGAGSLSPQELERWPSYPGSQMGAIALVRQTLSDADWLAQSRKDNYGIPPGALDALTDRTPPLYFEVSDELEAVRAAKIAREFKRPAIIKGSGMEFKRLDAIAEAFAKNGDAQQIPLIVPLAFPKAPDVSTVGAAEAAGLREMMVWEQAPSNVRRLKDKGIRVALTSSDLRSRSQFRANLEKAMRYGLAPDAAFAMLTTEPAAILGVENALGTLENGKAASFIVASGDLFTLPVDEPEEKGKDAKGDEKDNTKDSAKDDAKPSDEKPAADASKPGEGEKSGAPRERRKEGGREERAKPRKPEIREVYIDGVRNEVALAGAGQLAGVWDVTLDKKMDGDLSLTFTEAGELTITKKFHEQKDDKGNPKVTTSKAKNVSVDGRRVSYSFEHKPFGKEGIYNASAALAPDNQSMEGIVLLSSGDPLKWSAARKASTTEPAARKLPGLVGCFLLEEIDGKKGGGSLICIKKDGTVTLRMNNTVLKADDVSIKDGVLKYTCDMGKMTEPDRATPSDRLVKVEAKLEGDQLVGSMVVPDGSTHQWKGSRQPGDPEVLAELPDVIGYPFGPYERDDRAAFGADAPVVIITNATVWTSGPQGILKDASIVLRGGKIESVATGPAPSIEKAIVIDAKGKHVTPGIIDCHSHTGISRGVNEMGQAVTSEVRIQDVTDPDSISWYRQLAGGVTTVNSLHGSANAIGGQNAVNKNRWGVTSADDMHFAGRDTYDDANPFAPGGKKYSVIPGVKWALGENPRQVNGTSRNRYPQTRMGVETLIRDRLSAAREYQQSWEDWSAGKHAPGLLPPRRDLELEALAEVLNGSRWVHCHSYRQDELLALSRICKEFGFKLGTWQHILEGYKLATDVRDNSRGASAFADWWNYKVEVQDAIPQGPILMHDVGVVVSFNSDSDEMARRLNLEAAKAVKYGNLSEEEALKFVTINPAIQLGLEKRVGSLEAGKEADVVIWSADPLSVSSHAERVFIDGREMFSLETDAKLRKQNNDNRQRIIQKLKKEGPTRGGGGDGPKDSESDDDAALRERIMLDMLNRRGSLGSNMPGECGCGLVHAQ
ncbi:MAG: amidohydrolase family protein [Phycisphaerae bacterium]|nr:amidohydrolase family protein [Phycisphaerae bacterium]